MGHINPTQSSIPPALTDAVAFGAPLLPWPIGAPCYSGLLIILYLMPKVVSSMVVCFLSIRIKLK